MANAKMVAIGEVIGKYFNMDKRTMDSKTNKREIARVRQFAHYFANEYKVASLSKIGSYFGGTTHSTVLYSHKTILNAIATDKMEKAAHDSINKLIKARFKTDLSPNNKISELDMVKAVKRGLNDANSRIMFNLLLKEYNRLKIDRKAEHYQLLMDLNAKQMEFERKNKKNLTILQLSENDEIIGRFENRRHCVKELGLYSSSLSSVLNGKMKFTGGYKFIYEKDYEATKSRRIS